MFGWGHLLVGQQRHPTAKELAEKAVITPSDPLAKFIALKTIADGKTPPVQIEWPRIYQAVKRDFRPEDYDDLEVAIPLLLGSRIADGVVTVVMEDRRALNECAEDIRKLAHRLGASSRTLSRAEEARRLANAGEWGRVYTTLGFLQMNIVQELEAQGTKHPGRRAMVYIGGWTQGARFVAAIIDRIGYTEEASSVLRDPRLLEALQRLVNDARPKLPAKGASGELVAKIDKNLAELHRIVDQIKLSGRQMTGRISAEDVSLGSKLATEIVDGAASLKKGAVGAASSLGELQATAATDSVNEEETQDTPEETSSPTGAVAPQITSVLTPPAPSDPEPPGEQDPYKAELADVTPDEPDASADGDSAPPATKSVPIWIWIGGGALITAVLILLRRPRH